jgi:hypothetical protein
MQHNSGKSSYRDSPDTTSTKLPSNKELAGRSTFGDVRAERAAPPAMTKKAELSVHSFRKLLGSFIGMGIANSSFAVKLFRRCRL